LLRARKDRSSKLQALLNREAEDYEWLARRLNVTYARASALVSGGRSVTLAEEPKTNPRMLPAPYALVSQNAEIDRWSLGDE